jgi:hypothetical protein
MAHSGFACRSRGIIPRREIYGSRDAPHRTTLASCLYVADIVMADKITRIAIVDANRCKPKRCAQECKKVRQFH